MTIAVAAAAAPETTRPTSHEVVGQVAAWLVVVVTEEEYLGLFNEDGIADRPAAHELAKELYQKHYEQDAELHALLNSLSAEYPGARLSGLTEALLINLAGMTKSIATWLSHRLDQEAFGELIKKHGGLKHDQIEIEANVLCSEYESADRELRHIFRQFGDYSPSSVKLRQLNMRMGLRLWVRAFDHYHKGSRPPVGAMIDAYLKHRSVHEFTQQPFARSSR